MPNNDFILPISFRTAQEIGLEESVLISFLEQHAFMLSNRTLVFDLNTLSAQLPFWTGPMLQRILSSLQANQLLSFERNGEQLTILLDGQHAVKEPDHTATHNFEAAQKPVLAQTSNGSDELVNKLDRLQRQAKTNDSQSMTGATEFKQRKNLASSHMQFTHKKEQTTRSNSYESLPRVTNNSWPSAQKGSDDKRRGVSDFDLYLEQKERTRQPDQWQPEESTIEQISQAGIQRQFAAQLLPEFLLRIKEQRKNVRTWNSEFFKYVKRQWQYKQSDRSSYEGTQGSSYNTRTSKEQVSDALTNIHDTDW
ncbi:hypothetical protein MED121_05428 [Marinomonas sp. MED121]|uniref:DnaT-like ssDNA-binding domain-containing protein n=1 Tax=Marinomonas sp. MED121 TaxID=314277 RepID=UPI000068FC18|nr:DnaT-like ssDNA-binding domain-containing protein [Marinomonas sp. MED121]EAQ63802.1 hypothetical protein MED121_05428 [Marinomonas sp. MED121]